jgi:uncharacterized protein (TIGR02231 family)
MKPIMFAIAVLLNGMLFAQSPKVIRAKVEKATVYLHGAHLYYSENVTLAQGYNELVFENISPVINANSLQATSKGGMVMEVKHQLKYKDRPVVTRTYDKEIAMILDSLEEISFVEMDIEHKMDVLNKEKEMLLNNRLITGSPARDSFPVLKEGMAFLKEKLNSIYDQELKWERFRVKTDKLEAKLNDRYNTLLQLQGGEENGDIISAQPVNRVVVVVFSEAAGTSQINFNYFIPHAGWVPMYDLQASSATNDLQLKYYANVTQQSGIDWKNVGLTLSTSNPNENNTRPELTPWSLSFMEYYKKPLVSYNSAMPMGTYSKAEVITDKKLSDGKNAEEDSTAPAAEMGDYMAVSENLIRTEYEIKLDYIINSDGLPHKVMINQRGVPMQLQFAAVPKLCTDAFLMANLTGWEDMNIIPGNARLYFDGTYVGEMLLKANSTSDTLSVNLGRDKGISITRKKIKEKYKVKFIDNEKVETRSIELVVRNTKNIPIEVLLEDQIPVVSGTEEIKVTLVDSDGALLDEPTGKLKWNLKLNSKETKKLVFTYEVRYPKSKPVAGL